MCSVRASRQYTRGGLAGQKICSHLQNMLSPGTGPLQRALTRQQLSLQCVLGRSADWKDLRAHMQRYISEKDMPHPPHLQLRQQPRQEATLGCIAHVLRGQKELGEGLAVRGRERVQRKVRVLGQLLLHLLKGALVAKKSPARTHSVGIKQHERGEMCLAVSLPETDSDSARNWSLDQLRVHLLR